MWKSKIKNLNFAKIWKNSYFSYCLPHHSDLLYKKLHYALKTNDYTHKCTRDKTNTSPYCNYRKSNTYLQTAPKYNQKLPTIRHKVKKPIHIIPTHTNNKFQQQ